MKSSEVNDTRSPYEKFYVPDRVFNELAQAYGVVIAVDRDTFSLMKIFLESPIDPDPQAYKLIRMPDYIFSYDVPSVMLRPQPYQVIALPGFPCGRQIRNCRELGSILIHD
jgi:hypothetical protein